MQQQVKAYHGHSHSFATITTHPNCLNSDDQNELVYVDQIPKSAVTIMDVVDTRDLYLETAF